MVLLGTIVNGLAIMVGALLGKWLHQIPEKIKETAMHGVGLTVSLLGIQMGLNSELFLIVILSIVIGAIIGEYFALEDKLNQLGKWIETKVDTKENGNIAQGFVVATLLYVVGAMSIIGALDSGIRADHSILYTKSILDGFTAIMLTTTIGIGVIFSAIPVILYQGGIALFAMQIDRFIPEQLMSSFISEMTATGGIMILAIGLNLIGITKIRVGNLLPGIIVVGILVTFMYICNIL